MEESNEFYELKWTQYSTGANHIQYIFCFMEMKIQFLNVHPTIVKDWRVPYQEHEPKFQKIASIRINAKSNWGVSKYKSG